MKAVDNLEVITASLMQSVELLKAAAPNLEGELATTIQRRCENIREQLLGVERYVKNTAARVGGPSGE